MPQPASHPPGGALAGVGWVPPRPPALQVDHLGDLYGPPVWECKGGRSCPCPSTCLWKPYWAPWGGTMRRQPPVPHQLGSRPGKATLPSVPAPGRMNPLDLSISLGGGRGSNCNGHRSGERGGLGSYPAWRGLRPWHARLWRAPLPGRLYRAPLGGQVSATLTGWAPCAPTGVRPGLVSQCKSPCPVCQCGWAPPVGWPPGALCCHLERCLGAPGRKAQALPERGWCVAWPPSGAVAPCRWSRALWDWCLMRGVPPPARRGSATGWRNRQWTSSASER